MVPSESDIFAWEVWYCDRSRYGFEECFVYVGVGKVACVNLEDVIGVKAWFGVDVAVLINEDDKGLYIDRKLAIEAPSNAE